MTVEDTVKKSIIEYPSLYLCDNYEDSKFNVLEHYFLTLGNGIEWAHTKDPLKGGYLTEPKSKSSKGDWKRIIDAPYGKIKCTEDFSRYFSEKMFVVYDEDYNKNSKAYDVFESDVKLYKNPHLVLEIENKKREYPYPNFSKEFSCFWEIDPNLIQSDWKEEGLKHMLYWQEYFNDPERVKSYSHYHISDKSIKDVEKYIETYYIKEGKTIKQIGKEYGFPEFDGKNYKELQINRWNKELASIQKFLKETIKRLS